MKPVTLLLSKIAILCLFGLPIVALGQSDRERERTENDRDIELRSWNLKLISMNANKERRAKMRPEHALAQLQQDFTRLQLVNKALVFSIAEKKPVDFKFVSRSVVEIRKRAARLNEYLALPEAEKPPLEVTAVSNQNQLKLSVLRLGNLIYSFTNNPFFKEPSVIDSEKALTARRELLEIMELSDQIKKNTERLEKAVP